MRICTTYRSFETIIENGIIDKIVSLYCDNADEENICIMYANGRKHYIGIPIDSYNSQYGLPVSNDSSLLYVSSWEKGLMAYDIESGALVWRFKASRICDIAVYDGFIVVKKDSHAIIKLNEKTGEFISEIKSGTILRFNYLNDKFALVDSIRGKISLVDVHTMQIVRKYPHNFAAVNAYLRGNELHVTGFGEHLVIDRDFPI